MAVPTHGCKLIVKLCVICLRVLNCYAFDFVDENRNAVIEALSCLAYVYGSYVEFIHIFGDHDLIHYWDF